jgi:hypothetical protein
LGQINCTNCNREIQDNFTYCPYCGHQVPVHYLAERYANPYGSWSVTTEGDVEGRTVVNLGTYEGYLDEIALRLAPQAYYSLHFTKANDNMPDTKQCDEVNVSLNIESMTWDMNNDTLAKVMKEVFKDRPVEIASSNYYASFKIKRKE